MTSDNTDLILAVDLDGVCADFYARMREITAEWFERDVADLPLDVSYGLREWGIKTPEQYASIHRFAVTQRDLFRTLPMISGARAYLRRLSEEGVRIRIVTHRLYLPFLHQLTVSQTIDWLDGHGIPYWDLCFMKDKGQVGADIYVEDSPDNILALRSEGLHTICFGNSTNTDLAPPRAESWAEVYHLVRDEVHRRALAS